TSDCHKESYYEISRVMFSDHRIVCGLNDLDCKSMRVICDKNKGHNEDDDENNGWLCSTRTPWDSMYRYDIACLEDFEGVKDPRMRELANALLCEKPMESVCTVKVSRLNNH